MTDMTAIKFTVQLTTDEVRGFCRFCEANVPDSLDDHINHLIQEHGFILLHIGEDSGFNVEDLEQYPRTIAMLGCKKKPAEKPSKVPTRKR